MNTRLGKWLLNGASVLALSTVLLGMPNMTLAAEIDPTPVAHNDSLDTAVNKPTSYNVLWNDTSARGGHVTVSIPPKHGVISLKDDGFVTYTPNTGYVGSDSFAYKLYSPNKNNASLYPGIVTVTVHPMSISSRLDFMSSIQDKISRDQFASSPGMSLEDLKKQEEYLRSNLEVEDALAGQLTDLERDVSAESDQLDQLRLKELQAQVASTKQLIDEQLKSNEEQQAILAHMG